jgi:Stigma-specific protein, Stig1
MRLSTLSSILAVPGAALVSIAALLPACSDVDVELPEPGDAITTSAGQGGAGGSEGLGGTPTTGEGPGGGGEGGGGACGPGLTGCDETCADLQTDPANCGFCGARCPADQTCTAGSCIARCAPGQTACGSACVNVLTDPANCGACGVACPAGATCNAGVCEERCPGVACGLCSGVVCGGAEIGCNDDSRFGGVQSEVTVSLVAGQSVIIAVDGYGAATGSFTLNVR